MARIRFVTPKRDPSNPAPPVPQQPQNAAPSSSSSQLTPSNKLWNKKNHPPLPEFTSSKVLLSLDDAIDKTQQLVNKLKELKTSVKEEVDDKKEYSEDDDGGKEGKDKDQRITGKTIRDLQRLIGGFKEEIAQVEARLCQKTYPVFPKLFKPLPTTVAVPGPRQVNRDAPFCQSGTSGRSITMVSMDDDHPQPHVRKIPMLAQSELLPSLDDSVKESLHLVNKLEELQKDVDEKVTELEEDSSEEDEDEDDEYRDKGKEKVEKVEKLIGRTMRDMKRLVETFNEEFQLIEIRLAQKVDTLFPKPVMRPPAVRKLDTPNDADAGFDIDAAPPGKHRRMSELSEPCRVGLRGVTSDDNCSTTKGQESSRSLQLG